MAKTSSAKKAHRVAGRRAVFNVRRKKVMKEAVKKTGKLIVAKDLKNAEKSMPDLYKAIDKAAKHGTIKKNTAARMKSRIAKRLSAASK
ncbi:MAG TPA: 30S ribosomal protein S20 [Candidatus Paceibacterota bacterium]|nr:30S ribosomal protein S20 [Candidatus Paceibacterota bacterium]